MTKEKYMTNIDQVLINHFKKEAEKTERANVILVTKELSIKKIAFDVYRVDNDPYNDLWTLQEIDGKSHLVRASDPQFESTASGDWSAVTDYDRSNITLAYKGIPITRFSSIDYGFEKEDIITFKSALLDRVGTDSNFVKEVLAEQPASKREALTRSFPELNKLIKG